MKDEKLKYQGSSTLNLNYGVKIKYLANGEEYQELEDEINDYSTDPSKVWINEEIKVPIEEVIELLMENERQNNTMSNFMQDEGDMGDLYFSEEDIENYINENIDIVFGEFLDYFRTYYSDVAVEKATKEAEEKMGEYDSFKIIRTVESDYYLPEWYDKDDEWTEWMKGDIIIAKEEDMIIEEDAERYNMSVEEYMDKLEKGDVDYTSKRDFEQTHHWDDEIWDWVKNEK